MGPLWGTPKMRPEAQFRLGIARFSQQKCTQKMMPNLEPDVGMTSPGVAKARAAAGGGGGGWGGGRGGGVGYLNSEPCT